MVFPLKGVLSEMNTLFKFLTSVVVAAALAASLPASSTAQTAGQTMTTRSGLQITDTKVGTGATPRTGQICVMHYTGWLYQNGAKGQKFDSSVDRGQPFEFPIGTRRVIAGWDEGVASMKVGGKRTLVIPAALGYGARLSSALVSITPSEKPAFSRSRRINAVSW